MLFNDKKYKSGEAASQAAKLTGNKKLGKEIFAKDKNKKKCC